MFDDIFSCMSTSVCPRSFSDIFFASPTVQGTLTFISGLGVSPENPGVR